MTTRTLDRPGTLAPPVLTAGSLFTGIGGIDLAFSETGFDIRFQVEIDDYCRKVLKNHAPEYWPNATLFTDVREVGRHNLSYVDVLFGGFPCQDLSYAGQRRGIQEGTRSGLWFEFARIIGELRPRVVLLENVPGILTRDGTIVIANLAKMGYVGQWGTISASDVGAPHRRERLFIVAYCARNNGKPNGPHKFCKTQIRSMGSQTMGNPPRDRVEGQRDSGQQESGGYECQNVPIRSGQTVGNPPVLGCENLQSNTPSDRRSKNQRRVQKPKRGGQGQAESRLGRDFARISSWMDRHQFPAPPGPQYDWEPARTTTQTENRTARIKALGNAVVPQVIYPIAQAIREYLEIG